MPIRDAQRFSLFLLAVAALCGAFAFFALAEPAHRTAPEQRLEASPRVPAAFAAVPRDGTTVARRLLEADETVAFRDVDLRTEPVVRPAGRILPAQALDPAPPVPNRLRSAPAVSAAKSAAATADKASWPWMGDHLLADATHMNDETASLARSPITGDLYAVFAATDLGGTDRDIHIARSTDGGLTWTQWEMPSFSYDEYEPDLAIDAGGYLHVVWLRDDGYIVRARSANPDDPLNWSWVNGFFTDSINAWPSIAVSGSGSRAVVFIAASYQEVNWDLYAWEWTLLWMWSGDGGESVTYDALAPDGYPDVWPDAALSRQTVHLINGEVDYEGGPTKILLATDVIGGVFDSVVDLTSWTGFSSGFPSVACNGPSVFAVFQHDWDDGAGNLDGDVIYHRSADGGATVFGPYEIVADEYDSVGPVIYAGDGYVGCLWLETFAGGDEYEVIARQSNGDGTPDSWPAWVEVVSEQAYAEPQYRFLSGAVGDDDLHAVWIDRRDTPTQGHNVYTSERPLISLGTDVVPTPVVEASLSAAPNPFNPRTELVFRLPTAGRTRLELIDARGHRVRTLVDGELTSGEHLAVWDGADDAGRMQPSGVYLARLSLDDRRVMTTKLTLAR